MSPNPVSVPSAAEKRSTRKVRLFFGVRAAEDLFALEQLAEFGRAMPSFELVLVLLREWPADWQGETGPMAAAIRRGVSSAVDHDAYLCGAPWCIETTPAGAPGTRYPPTQRALRPIHVRSTVTRRFQVTGRPKTPRTCTLRGAKFWSQGSTFSHPNKRESLEERVSAVCDGYVSCFRNRIH